MAYIFTCFVFIYKYVDKYVWVFAPNNMFTFMVLFTFKFFVYIFYEHVNFYMWVGVQVFSFIKNIS